MAITQITRDYGDNVSIVRITTTNTLAEATAADYLTTQAANIALANNGPFTWLVSDMTLVYASDGWVFASVSADFTRLNGLVFSTTLVGGPAVVGNFASFASAGGNIEDLGFLPSDATKTTVVMAGSATIVGRIAHFVDTAGTVDDTAGTIVQGGSIQAGLSGTAGTLISFPGTAANGSLIVAGVNAGGAFNTTISNGVMGQSTVYTLPDILAATGGIVVSTAAVRLKSVAGAAAAGGAAAQSFTDAFCTTGSNVIGNWNTQANPASVLKIVPGNGSFVVTSSADAGVGTFNYIIMK